MRTIVACLSTLCAASAALGQASFSVSGYSENFDSMGTGGTAAPLGWKHFAASFGSNTTWGASIPASGTNSVASIAAGTAGTTLAVATTPSGANNNGINAARSASATSDRVLATSPTGMAGVVVQLQLSNDTGAALPGGTPLNIAFDTVRYTSAGSANELPGYWVFVSVDGGTTWANVTPNPTITTVPNSAGVTSSSLTALLPGAWNAAASLYIRFIDDNANQTSPDQIIGLNNVIISTSSAPVSGKCCFADGSCVETVSTSCAGAFAVSGVCTPNTCPPPPTGSCCQPDGACAVTIQSACTAPWTSGGVCAPSPCPVLIVSLPAAGYGQNFDSMGQTGTGLPAGWSHLSLSGSHDTFTYAGTLPSITTTFLPSSTATAINVGAGSSTLTANGTLIVLNDPTTQGSGAQAYNLGLSGSVSDRCLGTSPTGDAGNELQLRLRNDTGAALGAITIGYDIRRFRETNHNNSSYDASPYAGREEAPGYQLYASVDDGTTWSNVAELNPTDNGSAGVVVPPTAGVTSVPPTVVTLPASVAAGGTITLRWFDDNAQSVSPDQMIGLDNVVILTVDPATLGACCAGNGTCTLVADDDVCIGGIFRGVGVACAAASCPQPPSGSCCAADGSCSVTIQAACATLWTLDGSCSPNICPGPLAACCAADGTCSLAGPGQCGGFSVAGTCTPFLCRQPGDTRTCVFGDYGIDGGNQGAVASRMKTFNPGFLVTTGDNTYFTSNAISNYDNTQAKYYREFIKITNPSSAYFGQGAAVNGFFPVMGNHDMDIGGGASSAIPYWNAYWELPGNERSYTFSQGPIDFFMLSSDPREPDSSSATGTQHAWFVNAYNASTAQYKIVVFHHPAQTSVSGHGPDAAMRGWNFQNLPGITAVLSGHNHNMERLEFGGIPWFVTGAGGNSLYTISSVDPSSVFRNDTQWGFLMIDANAASITFRFVNAAGQILDTRSIVVAGACCRGSVCTVGASGACTGPNTRFAGVGSACNAPGNTATPCCRADFNQSGAAGVQDIFDYLAAWFVSDPAADFNGSSHDEVQDIFDFLAAWFVGC